MTGPARIDLIVHNLKLYTVDQDFASAQGMAVHGGRILAVGGPEELFRRWTPARVLDGRGGYGYPGFLDAHSHLLSYSNTLAMADLTGARSWAEVLDRLLAHQRQQPGGWLQGRGWDQNLWPGQAYPTRELLDRAFPLQPVYLTRVDGHAAMANGAALALAGADPGTRVDGGELVQADGRLTGLLIDHAIDLVKLIIPMPDRGVREQALLQAQANCLAVGLTSVGDAGTECEDVQLLEDMQRDGRLKLRIYAMLRPTEANFARFVAKGIHCTDRMTVRSIKAFADGALGSRGALMLQPYADDPGNSGLQLTPSDRLEEICRRAAAAGYQVNTHCIGDGAVRLVLGIYGHHLQPGNGRRWRIEHAQVVDPEDLPAFGALGIIPSVQTSHATSDMGWAAERLGPRIRWAYRYQDLLRQNGWLANGSDFPIEPINPLFGFYAGVARKDRCGRPRAGFQPENGLTREQALRAMTIWAARANFQELDRGSLEVGKWADFVILDRDLMQVPEPELLGAQVLATHIAGEQVHPRPA